MALPLLGEELSGQVLHWDEGQVLLPPEAGVVHLSIEVEEDERATVELEVDSLGEAAGDLVLPSVYGLPSLVDGMVKPEDPTLRMLDRLADEEDLRPLVEWALGATPPPVLDRVALGEFWDTKRGVVMF